MEVETKLIIDHVPVPPFIRIRNKVVIVRNQNPAMLECEVEAFPEPVVHWERGDGRRLKMSDKYRTEVYDRRDNYKVIFLSNCMHFINFCALLILSSGYCLFKVENVHITFAYLT